MKTASKRWLLPVRVLAVTEGAHGTRIYWHGDVRRFRPPEVKEVDSTGAGDIFAAAFFTRLHTTRDPWEAARFATQLAAYSVTRPGLSGIPTAEEIQECLVEVILADGAHIYTRQSKGRRWQDHNRHQPGSISRLLSSSASC